MACTNRTPLSRPALVASANRWGASRVTAEVYGSLDQRVGRRAGPLVALANGGVYCDICAVDAVRCLVILFVPLTARGGGGGSRGGCCYCNLVLQWQSGAPRRAGSIEPGDLTCVGADAGPLLLQRNPNS